MQTVRVTIVFELNINTKNSVVLYFA